MSLSWPDPLPARGPVVLRPYRDSDLPLIAEQSTDPYIPLIGTVPHPYTEEAGLAYIARQHLRLTSRTGWSFAIAEVRDDRAVGGAGLWIRDIDSGRATAGYAVARAHGVVGLRLRLSRH